MNRVYVCIFLAFAYVALLWGIWSMVLPYILPPAEAEVSEPNCLTTVAIEAIDPNCIWPEIIFLELTLIDEPNFTDRDRIYLYEGDDFDIVIEKKEPPEPNEPSICEFHCPCGWQYKVIGHDLYYYQKYSIVTDIHEPKKIKPDITKLVGGLKTIAQLIEYYQESQK